MLLFASHALVSGGNTQPTQSNRQIFCRLSTSVFAQRQTYLRFKNYRSVFYTEILSLNSFRSIVRDFRPGIYDFLFKNTNMQKPGFSAN